jgi:hypothetical protein
MANSPDISYSPDYIPINEACEQLCAELIKCTLINDELPEVPEVDFTKTSETRPAPDDIAAVAEIVTPDARANIRSQLMKDKDNHHGDYHQRWITVFDPAYDDYGRAEWEIAKRMCIGIIRNAGTALQE